MKMNYKDAIEMNNDLNLNIDILTKCLAHFKQTMKMKFRKTQLLENPVKNNEASYGTSKDGVDNYKEDIVIEKEKIIMKKDMKNEEKMKQKIMKESVPWYKNDLLRGH